MPDEMPDEPDSLKHQLEKELQGSEWLKKFKQLSDLLLRLKTELPLTQLCKVEWKTDSDTLLIRCPNPEIRDDLLQKAAQIVQLCPEAPHIILEWADDQHILKP